MKEGYVIRDQNLQHFLTATFIRFSYVTQSQETFAEHYAIN